MTFLKKVKRAVIGIYLVGLHLFAGFFLSKMLLERYDIFWPFEGSKVTTSSVKEELSTPRPVASTPLPVRSVDIDPSTLKNEPPPVLAGKSPIIVPVVGIGRDQLHDTFSESRSGTRIHDAIDIPAPAGTPVMAAADGQIVKFFDSQLGGTAIYQLSTNRKIIYYYAHLQRRADGLNEGDPVKQGTVIAYVGDTGNAGPGNNHLHFSIAIANDPRRYWEGTYLNPYPILQNGTIPEVP